MTFLFVVLAIGVVALVAVVITGRYIPDFGIQAEADRPLGAEFDVVIRGYRMSEVDQRIASLEREVESLKEKTGSR